MALSEDAVREELKKVIDPELFVNIVDLGLVYLVDLTPGDDDKTAVKIEMTMTSPMCPAGPQLVGGCKQVVSQMDGVAEVDVKVVMDMENMTSCELTVNNWDDRTLDFKYSDSDAFDVGHFDFEPRQLEPNLFAMAMNTEDSLREYLRLFVRIPLLGRIG